MTRLQELLDLNAKETARIEAERAAKKEMDEAQARAEALAANVAMREKGRALLGALFDELAPAEAVASDSPIPLCLGPGQDFLYFGMRWKQGSGNLPVLLVNHRDRSGDSLLWLPAAEARIAEYVDMAVRAREYKRTGDWQSLHSDYYEDNDERRMRAEIFKENWPELADQAQAWLDGELARQAAKLAERNARQADQAETPDAERASAPAEPTPAPTDAERALALVREMVNLVHVHQAQE